MIIKRNFLSKTYVYRESSFYDFSAWSLFYMFTPTLCGPAYGTIQKKIVVKLRFYNDLLLFEGLFEDPREGFLKPISGERGIRTPETLLTFTRFPGVPLQPLEHLSLAM